MVPVHFSFLSGLGVLEFSIQQEREERWFGGMIMLK